MMDIGSPQNLHEFALSFNNSLFEVRGISSINNQWNIDGGGDDVKKKHSKFCSKVKAYICDDCSRPFATKQSLKVHSITHTSQRRPFVCEVCSKRFQTRQNLRSHTNIHLGLKPHKCQKCNKSFAEKSTLTKHIRTHGREKPYKCDHCDNTFSQVSSQQRHVTNFHRSQQQCDVTNSQHKPDNFLPNLGMEIIASELGISPGEFPAFLDVGL